VSHSVENAVRTTMHDERLDDTNASDDPARELQGGGMISIGAECARVVRGTF
jgi:hypothetical protein